MSSFLLCFVLLALPFQLADGEGQKPSPNVVMIAIDDLNDWVQPLSGHALVQTPHMDRLARRGVNFRNAHCQAPLCNPSRTSILTGLRPSTTGVYALAPWFRVSEKHREHVSLPQALGAGGYTTLTTGKVYHDAYPPRAERLNNSEFTVWGYHGGYGPLPEKKFVDTPAKMPVMDWGPFPEKDELQEDWKVADWAIEQLRNPPKAPFFLSVGFRRPHVPCFAPKPWFDLYPSDDTILPPVLPTDRDDLPAFASYLHWRLPEPRLGWLQREKQWIPLVEAYLACISFVDSQVGRVLDALDASGAAGNTIVILWSDHGWHLGEKGISGKNTLWTRSTHVPFLWAGPGIARGATCAEPVELLDIYPTLLDLCGLPSNPKLEGHSLVPQLEDPARPREFPAITTHNQGNHSVRSLNYRYIRYADGSEELYDEQADPNEWTNIAGDPKLLQVKEEHARFLPKHEEPALPGSSGRLLLYEQGRAIWEGNPIEPGSLLPQD